MQEDPEKSGNFDELEEIEEDDDFETEDEIKFRWKLRIIAIVSIVLCASSIIISVCRRNALGHGGKEKLDYDLFSDVDDDDFVDVDTSAPKKITNSEQIKVNANENNENNVNSNEGKKKSIIESESEDQTPSSPSSENDIDDSNDSKKSEEESAGPSPGGSFAVNPNPAAVPTPIIIDEGSEGPSEAEKVETEVEEIPPIDDEPSAEPLVTIEPITIEPIEVKPAEITATENTENPPTKLKKPVPKVKIYEPEFVNLRADYSDEDIGEEIVKPVTFEEPKGILFYESYGQIKSGEFGNRYRHSSSSNIDFDFLPCKSNFASLSFTADHKKIAFALIDEKCKIKKMSKILVKDFEQMSTLEICGDEGNYCYDPHMSPDGKLVIYRKGDWKTLYYYNIEIGVETKLDLPPNSMKYTPILFADGKRFVFVALLNRKYKIIVSDIFNTQKSKCVYESDIRPIELAVSPNGRYIAFTFNHFIQVIAVNDKERLDKKFKFDMPLPSPDDPPKSEYYSSLTQRIMYYAEEFPKFSRPFWSPDSMKLFFAASDSYLYYTGYGHDKWKSFYVRKSDNFYGFMLDIPKMKTGEIVKSALDDIIGQVELLNSTDEDNWINEITLNIENSIDEPVEIEAAQETDIDNNTNLDDNDDIVVVDADIVDVDVDDADMTTV